VELATMFLRILLMPPFIVIIAGATSGAARRSLGVVVRDEWDWGPES